MKTYLGDTVYADVEHETLKLTMEPGDQYKGTGEPDHVIYLSEQAFKNLEDFISKRSSPVSV